VKCARCDKEAEYIFVVFGMGGSYCKECFEYVRREAADEFLRKARPVKERPFQK
jgi:late competence protein required for DNA uptake (superfamily II DNA/RNA helicase)